MWRAGTPAGSPSWRLPAADRLSRPASPAPHKRRRRSRRASAVLRAPPCRRLVGRGPRYAFSVSPKLLHHARIRGHPVNTVSSATTGSLPSRGRQSLYAASALAPFSDGVIAPEPLISATSLAE